VVKIATFAKPETVGSKAKEYDYSKINTPNTKYFEKAKNSVKKGNENRKFKSSFNNPTSLLL
jgi:hypothetical protein